MKVIDWISILGLNGTSFVFARFIAPAGNTNCAPLSLAGEPPIQFVGSDQRELVAPVQVWVTGVNLISKDSRQGR
jgi:hypothetical protein